MSAPIGVSNSPNSCRDTVWPMTDDQRGGRLVVGRNFPSRLDFPVGHRRIVGADALDAGGPVLIAVLHLAGLADEVADATGRGALAPDGLRVGGGERRGAAESAAHAARGLCARQHHDEIGAEAFDLLAHGVVGALADGDHGNQGRHADEDAEHGQGRPHHVAPDCLQRGGHNHHGEGPGGMGVRHGQRLTPRARRQRRRRRSRARAPRLRLSAC